LRALHPSARATALFFLAAAAIFFIPFVLLVIFEKVLPTFRHLES
jgi:hypothetical protein